MAINLKREGIALNAEERNKRNENLTIIEQELEKIGSASALAELAKLAADDAKVKTENVQQQVNALTVSGDSSPQATQASVGADGTDYDGNLKARLDAEHNTVTAQLADKVGGGTKAKPEDLDEETLALVTGQGTINLESIPQDYSVTPKKTNFLTPTKNIFNKNNVKNGVAVSSTGVESSNASYVTGNFEEIEPGTNYFADQFYYILLYDLNFNFISRLTVWKTETEDLRSFLTPANARYIRGSINTLRGNLDLAQITKGSSLSTYEPFGAELSSNISIAKAIPFNDLDFHGFFIGMPEKLNFDFFKRTITILSGAGRIIHKKGSHVINEQTVDFSTLPGYYYKLIFNISTKAVSVIDYSAPVPLGHLVFGGIHPASHSVYNIEHCYVNGSPKNITNQAVKWSYTDDAFPLSGDLSQTYSAPVMLSKAIDSSDYLENKTAADMDALYAELAQQYPNYFKRTLLGNEPTGLPIYRYDLKPERPGIEEPVNKVPKIIITSGVHGPEKAAGWTTYLLIKQICEKWDTHTTLEVLRWDVHIILIAIVNPWGWNNNDRRNSNGVDINRNFPALWNPNSVVGDSTYGGVVPLSETETQLVDSVLASEKDVIYVMDTHNFSTPTNNNYFIWNPAGTTFNANLSRTLLSKMSRKWKKEQAYLPQDDTTFFGYVSGTPGGTVARQAASAYGLQSSTFEISARFMLEQPEPKNFSSLVFTMALEAYVNWLALCIRNNIPLINSQKAKRIIEV